MLCPNPACRHEIRGKKSSKFDEQNLLYTNYYLCRKCGTSFDAIESIGTIHVPADRVSALKTAVWFLTRATPAEIKVIEQHLNSAKNTPQSPQLNLFSTVV